MTEADIANTCWNQFPKIECLSLTIRYHFLVDHICFNCCSSMLSFQFSVLVCCSFVYHSLCLFFAVPFFSHLTSCDPMISTCWLLVVSLLLLLLLLCDLFLYTVSRTVITCHTCPSFSSTWFFFQATGASSLIARDNPSW